jgi:acetyl esterase/lipase
MAQTHPPLDSELGAALDEVGEHFPALTSVDMIPTMRAAIATYAVSDDDLRRNGAIEFDERSIPGPAGAPDLSILICRPAGLSTLAPGVYHTHGGGMIMGDNRVGLATLLDWVEELGVVVVSVEYRLAPEDPHPAPVEDCYAGLRWTANHAAELGIDGGRLVIAGASAGGGLAAGVVLLARERGGPPLLGQVLMCPMLDDRSQTPSSRELDGDGVWDQHANLIGWTALLGDAVGGPDVHWSAAPARAADLAGLPPAYIDVGSVETFRDEDVEYASRIWQAGGVADLHVWAGGFHGFDGVAPEAAVSKMARSVRTEWLRRLLASVAP